MPAPSRIHSDEDPTNRDIMDAVLRLDVRAARVEHLLNGSSDPARGLVVRVDRLEQKSDRNTWWASTALGAAIVAFVAGLYEVIKKGTVGP